MLFEQRAFPQRRFDQGFRGGLAVLFEQTLIQRTCIDANANRNACVACGLGDVFDLVIKSFDVAGVNAHASTASINSGENVLRLKVNVGDHRNAGLLGNGRECFNIVLARNSNAHNLATRSGELSDLLQRGIHVRGQGGGHRLHGDRRIPADQHWVRGVVQQQLTRLASRG